MPEVTEQASPPRPRRGMLGFYVAGFVFLGLVGLCAWLWTPIRILYWETKVTRAGAEGDGYSASAAAVELVRIGPAARPAIRRLLRSATPGLRWDMLTGIRDANQKWVVAEVVDSCRDEQDGKILGFAASVMRHLVGITLSARSEETAALRRQILDWWEREGKAKYGEGGK